MDAAVGDEPLQGHLGDLALERRKGGQDDGFRGVVDDEIDAGGGLDGPDVAALAADDAALHLLGRQGHGGDGLLGHEVAGIALDGQGQDLLAVLVGGLLGLHLDLPHHAGGLMPGLGLDLLHEPLFRLFHGEAGDFLQPLVVFVGEPGQLFRLFRELAFLAGQPLFRGQHLGFLLDDLLLLFLQALAAAQHLIFFFVEALPTVPKPFPAPASGERVRRGRPGPFPSCGRRLPCGLRQGCGRPGTWPRSAFFWKSICR